jgi:hypothetical protein
LQVVDTDRPVAKVGDGGGYPAIEQLEGGRAVLGVDRDRARPPSLPARARGSWRGGAAPAIVGTMSTPIQKCAQWND